MKLKNKKTGIIGELHFEPDKEYHFTVATEDPADVRIYKKLADLYADWEDYEEPKWYWYINCFGKVLDTLYNGNEWYEQRKLIGNYFLTKEEAEKAVEKLKAWKRLKDKGFKIKGWKFTPDMKQIEGNYVKIECEIPQILINEKDIDLLFGGEE